MFFTCLCETLLTKYPLLDGFFYQTYSDDALWDRDECYKLDGQGKARREAARRRNSECRINFNSRNSSCSNGSRPTAVQRAVIGRRRGALVAAPRRWPVTGKEGVSEGYSI